MAGSAGTPAREKAVRRWSAAGRITGGGAVDSHALSTGTGVSPLPSSAHDSRFNTHPPTTNRLPTTRAGELTDFIKWC